MNKCPYDSKHKIKSHDIKILRKNCGHGIHSKISVIKSKIDGCEYIWKKPVNDDPKHIESFKKEIVKAKKWREYGLSSVKACWLEDKKSLIKTLVKGPTLRQILHDHPHFFSNTHNKAYKELGHFVRLLVKSRHYIQDCNRSNIVYDKEKKKWNLIDSSTIQKKRSRSQTAAKYRKTFIERWSLHLYSDREKNALIDFLDKYCI